MGAGVDFDNESLEFKDQKRRVPNFFKKAFKWFFICSLIAVLYYLLFSIFFSTPQEKKLLRENIAIQDNIGYYEEKIEMMGDVIQHLQAKDKEIYLNIFNTLPPTFIIENEEYGEFLQISDTLDFSSLIMRTSQGLNNLDLRAKAFNQMVMELEQKCLSDLKTLRNIPSIIPIADFTESKVGATIGKKMHPFYKTITQHNGIDLVTSSGTKVLSTADGVVKSVKKSQKGKGNHIAINHGNGYVTLYAHLSNISVREGQRVKVGDVIGRVGTSGTTFAPHLHYEVIFNGEYLNPIDYFFVDLDPTQYHKVMMIGVNTGQSLD